VNKLDTSESHDQAYDDTSTSGQQQSFQMNVILPPHDQPQLASNQMLEESQESTITAPQGNSTPKSSERTLKSVTDSCSEHHALLGITISPDSSFDDKINGMTRILVV
jgi:hypothetical protein